MSLILYSDKSSKNLCGVKQIDNIIFKKLMYNEIHKKSKFIVSKEKIEEEFEEKIITNEKNVDLIVMTTLSESQLKIYLEIYQEETDNLDKFNEFLSIITYNQVNPEKFKIKRKLEYLLSTISEYWEDPANCNFTLTDKFVERRFNNSNYLNNIDSINKVISEQNKNIQIDWNSREINYLNDLIRDNYTRKDMSHKKYYISKISSSTNNDIITIYKQLPNEYMKYIFIANMLCSRSNCHLILNNYELLKLAKPIFDKYKIVFKYLIGYAWITLKNEEYYNFQSMKDTDRIVFDIDTANLLPVFPFTWDDINQNPYASLLIDKKISNVKHNCLTFNMMKNYEKYYGVCTSEEFSRRLNIFLHGINKKGILDYIDWSCCVITGSVMTACGMKYNPLMDVYKTSDTDILTDYDIANFFFHNYSDSDIDLICNKETMIEFINVVDELVGNLKNISNNVIVNNIHTGTIIISDEFIANEIDEIKKSLKSNIIDIQYIKNNLSNQEIKNYFYDKFYIPWKIEQQDEFKKQNICNNELINDYLKPISKEEFRIYNLNYELYEEKMKKKDYEKYFYIKDIMEILPGEKNKLIGKLSESIRFKINSSDTKTIEIFKSKDENYFSIISKFHMGFVRAFWNGKTVKCIPSYITSMMLQLSVDYKYFASIRDPIEIINKYRSRGFGIILNEYEKLHMAYYNTTVIKDSDVNKKWIKMYNVNIKSKYSVENIFGAKKLSDDIFKPSKFFMDLPNECYKYVNHYTTSSFEESFNTLLSPSTNSLVKWKAINDNGYINPLSKEVIIMGYNSINSSNI